MKKIIFSLLSLLAIVGMTSCSNENEFANEANEPMKYKFNISVNSDAMTRSIKSGWENGDEVYVFFGSEMKMLVLLYNDALPEKWSIVYNNITPGSLTSGNKCLAIWAANDGRRQLENTTPGKVFFKMWDSTNNCNINYTPELMDNYESFDGGLPGDTYTVDVEGNVTVSIHLRHPFEAVRLAIENYNDDKIDVVDAEGCILLGQFLQYSLDEINYSRNWVNASSTFYGVYNNVEGISYFMLPAIRSMAINHLTKDKTVDLSMYGGKAIITNYNEW